LKQREAIVTIETAVLNGEKTRKKLSLKHTFLKGEKGRCSAKPICIFASILRS
jgi:hypothetical protein